MRSGVICGGSVLVDVNKTIDRYPAVERLAFIEEERCDTGGAGLNLAIDLRRLGAPFPVDLVGLVGDDAHGRLVRETCRAAGVGTAGLVATAEAPTSYTDVMIARDGGRRTFFHRKGASSLLTPAHFDLGSTRARILHLGPPGALDGLDRATPAGNGFVELLRRARELGLRTNLEMVTLPPERTQALVRPCLPFLDTLVVNELEAGALAGLETHAGGEPAVALVEAAARRLVELGVSQLVVVHFPRGCAAAAPGGRRWRQGAVRVPPGEVVSTNGAGDAFAAGVILGLHEGWEVERCLEAGVAVAAVSLGAQSTSGAIRPIAGCLAHARERGFHEVGG
jgi:sugar/nucleoside kinase (ribokinase family)